MQSIHNRIIIILVLLIITITLLYILTSEMKLIISKYFKISGLHVGVQMTKLPVKRFNII